MESLSKDDFSNKNFRFATSKFINIGDTKLWAQRLSYVGELGYELYVNISDAKNIYEKIIDTGKIFNISNCGMHSLDTMRMESGFLHWGHDISPKKISIKPVLILQLVIKKILILLERRH